MRLGILFSPLHSVVLEEWNYKLEGISFHLRESSFICNQDEFADICRIVYIQKFT